MEFRETLLAAQKNQQQKSSQSSYYKARFDPPKKEQKQRDRLSANIQKFLAKKDEEEKRKKFEAQKKKDELHAMRDPKALRKIQKTLKVIKSANKSVLADAIDNDHTAVTLEGHHLPDQDDYGYESKEASALYEKWVQKYSKMPDDPKFPTAGSSVKKDLNGTRERVKNALLHEQEPVPHKRRRRGEGTGHEDRDHSPTSRYEPEKSKDEKQDRPKVRKQAPPPMDFNQLLKLAEQKKSEPVEVVPKKTAAEQEHERLMTKRQKREYEEEMARRQRRQERIEAEKMGGKKVREERPQERDSKREPSGFGRIPKIGEKSASNFSPKLDREKQGKDRERIEKEKSKYEKEKWERERIDKERLEKLRAERERIDRDIERLNKDRDRLEKAKSKLETNKPLDKTLNRSKINSKDQVGSKNIDLKSQNTYRIDKNCNEKKFAVQGRSSDGKYVNSHSTGSRPDLKTNRDQLSQKSDIRDKARLKASTREGSPRMNGHSKLDTSKIMQESSKAMLSKRPDDRKPMPSRSKNQVAPTKQNVTNTFDFDKHVSSLSKNGHRPGMMRSDGSRPGGDKRRPGPDDSRRKRRALHSDSEYDSEMDDFIDDGDENMDYSKHIKEIFGYDKSKYQYMDDDDDPTMESSFARQQREEYISKKIGIMEDLEDMKMEAMQKKKSGRRRISDD